MRFPSLGALSILALLTVVCANGCSHKPAGPPTARKTWILSSLGFTRESNHVAPGFDLDHKVTTTPDPDSCGMLDLVAPDGTPGIDNQLSLLIPVVEKQFGNAVDGIISGAINDGRLLIALDLANVSTTTDSRGVDMEVKLAQGKPSVGTDGALDAFQTFDLKRDGQIVSPASNGTFANGTFTIGPFPLHIPIAIFDVAFTIYIRDAIIRFTVDDNGDAVGLLGGSISMEEVADGVKNGAGVAPLLPQIRGVGLLFADMGLDPDSGKCSLLSAALAFKARPAFLR